MTDAARGNYSMNPKGACMRCGFKFDLHKLSKEWTGLRVCSDCWDKKPEAIHPPSPLPEGLVKPNASPEPADTFITPGPPDRSTL
jgi:hypothetical protein